jgi:DNA-binding NarL/FixJ family response regulator
MRVVLAEDNLLVRAGVAALLATVAEVELVRTCSSLDELHDAVAGDRPDVVVTDIRMPPSHTDEGVRAAVAFRTSHPHMGVVVLSHYLDPQLALTLVEHGSRGRGYLLKERLADTAQLRDAILSVAHGGSFIDPVVVDALVASRAGGAGTELQLLTGREQEILGALASGRSNQAIAVAFGVTGRTVEKHINSIFSKLGLAEDADVHRRVTSVLMYLGQRSAAHGGAGTDDPRHRP